MLQHGAIIIMINSERAFVCLCAKDHCLCGYANEFV